MIEENENQEQYEIRCCNLCGSKENVSVIFNSRLDFPIFVCKQCEQNHKVRWFKKNGVDVSIEEMELNEWKAWKDRFYSNVALEESFKGYA